jgi:hypothetical protein
VIARRVGVGIALATILVQAPRLVLAVLAADRQAVSAEWERALLVVAGVGTALVLTGGNLYLAHTIASVRRWRGRLAVVWLAVLVSSGGLVVPLIAAGLGGRKLPEVLAGETQAWAWSLLAALAHEVTAAGCVLAAAAAAERSLPGGEGRGEVDELLAELRAGGGQLAGLRLEQAGSGRRAAGSGAQRLAEPLACREGCGRSFASAQAESGHLRLCPARAARLSRLPAPAGG